MDNIVLKDVEVQGNFVQYHFEATGRLEDTFISDTLWVQYEKDISQVPESILTIPFVSIMLPVMWMTNSVLWVKSVDYTFYESTFNIRRAFQELYPKCPLKGRLVVSILDHINLPESKDTFILFSGGVDAHASFMRHEKEISHLVNIQGFYNDVDASDVAAEADYRDILHFTRVHNKQFDFVKSNFARLIRTESLHKPLKLAGDSLWHGFQHSMAFISIAIPLAFISSCSKVMIASSFTTGDSRVCASYPTTDSEYCFAQNGITVHDGFELSRQEKIQIIVNYQERSKMPYPIRVCSFNDHNCCKCEKCFRTILGIVAEGGNIKNFGFNIDKPLKEHWQSVMTRQIAFMGFNAEIVSHWPHIIKRLKKNYQNLNQEQREFADWFLSFDFRREKKKAVWRHYRENFFSILKRKIQQR